MLNTCLTLLLKSYRIKFKWSFYEILLSHQPDPVYCLWRLILVSSTQNSLKMLGLYLLGQNCLRLTF